MQAGLPFPGRERLLRLDRLFSEQFSQPLSLPRAGSTNPPVRAEGRHIKPGNNPATEASKPRAPLRSFLLPGRSLFPGVAGVGMGVQVVMKGESEIDTTHLIFNFNKTRSTS